MPFSYNDNPNDIYDGILSQTNTQDRGSFNRNLEAEIQVSFAFSVANKLFSKFDLMAAYTHEAWWQLYNSDWSKPFRETNYSPERFLRHLLDRPISFLGGKIVGDDVGYIHQSNGQIQQPLRRRGYCRVWRAYASGVGGSCFFATI